jgi:hypothetical protein
MEYITNEPASPAANFLLYMLSLWLENGGGLGHWARHTSSKRFFGNNIVMWNPTNATAGVWLGTVGATAGTYRGLHWFILL